MEKKMLIKVILIVTAIIAIIGGVVIYKNIQINKKLDQFKSEILAVKQGIRTMYTLGNLTWPNKPEFRDKTLDINISGLPKHVFDGGYRIMIENYSRPGFIIVARGIPYGACKKLDKMNDERFDTKYVFNSLNKCERGNNDFAFSFFFEDIPTSAPADEQVVTITEIK